MSLQETEAECAANAKAPRVSLADIEKAVVARFDMTAHDAVARNYSTEGMSSEIAQPLKLLSISVVVLRNGFTIIGKSAPASPENYNAELGFKLAYEDAVRQIWPMMGFALRDRLWRDTADAEAFHSATKAEEALDARIKLDGF